MKISVIGAGNLATHLVETLDAAGFDIQEVFSRDIINAKKLTKDLYNSTATDVLNFEDSQATLFFLAVTDDALEEVIPQLVLPENAILAHTSGSFSLSELSRLVSIHHDLPVETAVFYPLMTFSKAVSVDFKKIPICIEANNNAVEQKLIGIAKTISNTVYTVDSQERKKLHLAAIFACNFTNHLLALSKEIMDENDLEFDLVKPLIKATITKAFAAQHPADVQTGPAVRGDEKTIKAHLAALTDNQDLLTIYKTMTKSIQNWHNG